MNFKRNIILVFLSLSTIFAMAIPAKRGQWRNVKLADGSEVKVQLVGDEHGHWFVSESGNCYIPTSDNSIYQKADEKLLIQKAAQRRKAVADIQTERMKQLRKIGGSSAITGIKKGLILLVEFKNMAFKPEHDHAFFERFANEEGFSEGLFSGSVRDYFMGQSFGEFVIDFDVVGPITLERNYSYYGGNNLSGNDLRPGQMVAEACMAADGQINFSDYDWDGDGIVEQVFVLYAGQGEADGGAANTIWPHMHTLAGSDYGEMLELDGVKINTYACSNEIYVNAQGTYRSAGIGALCHEFSHCLGYPDFYDISYTGNFGLGDWDLMDHGAYNGSGFIPAGYSAYERMVAGWRMPIELRNDTIVSGMKPVNAEDGEAFIIYNRAYPDEYYILENRKKTGWDSELPGEGMLIVYGDYSETFWRLNIVNTTADYTQYGFPLNNHRRMTIIPANNSYVSSAISGHPYPNGDNNEFSNTSRPAATLFHQNTDGTRLLNIKVSDISRDSEGLISFNFTNQNTIEPEPEYIADPSQSIFYESFDGSSGMGGNDDVWVGELVGRSLFVADNEGWESSKDSRFGALRCARFGTGSNDSGKATTPTFDIEGKTIFRFKAAPFGADPVELGLSVNGENVSIEPESFTMEAGKWTIFTATIDGQGPVSVTFSPTRRFFLDEIMAVDESITSVKDFNSTDKVIRKGIYSLSGVYMGNDISCLPNGIYIVNGKKVCIK